MFVAIPIEIAIRELEGQLWLALHLVQKGIPCLIGGKAGIYRLIKEPGVPFVVVDKGLACFQREQYEEIINDGGRIVELYAEGLSYISVGIENMAPLQPIEHCFDMMFAWGQEQEQLIRHRLSAGAADKVLTTGYPSFDLLSHEFRNYYKKQWISDKFGDDYILYNSCLGTLFSPFTFDEWQLLMPGSPSYSNEKRTDWLEAQRLEQKYFESLKSLFKKINARWPTRLIVYRPHPAEDLRKVKHALRGYKNVVVVRDGGVRPWIVGCSVLINYFCTTSIEAMMLGKPAISFRPYQGEMNTEKVSRGAIATSNEEVLRLIDYFDQNHVGDSFFKEHIDTWSPALNNIKEKSAKIISEYIHERYFTGRFPSECKNWTPNNYTLLKQIKHYFRQHKDHFESKFDKKKNLLFFLKQRKIPYGSITEKKVQKICFDLAKYIHGCPQIKIRQVEENTVYIEPEA